MRSDRGTAAASAAWQVLGGAATFAGTLFALLLASPVLWVVLVLPPLYAVSLVIGVPSLLNALTVWGLTTLGWPVAAVCNAVLAVTGASLLVGSFFVS